MLAYNIPPRSLFSDFIFWRLVLGDARTIKWKDIATLKAMNRYGYIGIANLYACYFILLSSFEILYYPGVLLMLFDLQPRQE